MGTNPIHTMIFFLHRESNQCRIDITSEKHRGQNQRFRFFHFINSWFVNLRENILAWTRIRTRLSMFTRWRSNQLSHPGDSLSQARILLLSDPHYLPVLSVMEENTYVGITLIRGFYVNVNLKGKFSSGSVFEPGSPALRAGALTN